MSNKIWIQDSVDDYKILEDRLVNFFETYPAFKQVTVEIWEYLLYLRNCVIGGELNSLQLVEGIFFVTNGRSVHICGTDEDLEAFKCYYKWSCQPEQLETAYPNIKTFLEEYGEGIPREIIQFYHTHREYYDIAPYYAFKAYLRSIVPGGVLIIRDHQFFIVNDTKEYQIGLYGEAQLFDKWCQDNHRPPQDEDEGLFCYDDDEPKEGDPDFESYTEQMDQLNAKYNYLEEKFKKLTEYSHKNLTPFKTYKLFFKEHPEFLEVLGDESNYLQEYIPDCIIDGKITPMKRADSLFFVETRYGNHICGTPEDLEAYKNYCNWQQNIMDPEDQAGICGCL